MTAVKTTYRKCLKCGRPHPNTKSYFCTAKCKAAFQSGMETYSARLAKTKLVGEQPELF